MIFAFLFPLAFLFSNASAQVPTGGFPSRLSEDVSRSEDPRKVVGAIKMEKESPPSSVVFGFIPSEDPRMLKKNATAFAKLMSSKIGTRVDVFIPKDYAGLIEAMKQKKVDYAFFTAMSFVYAERESGAKVLLKKVWDNPFYHSAIYVRSDDQVRGLKDLKGKRIAFVDQKSTSGFLYPLAQLEKAGVKEQDLASKLFLGTHEKAAQALLRGEVDASAVFADSSDGGKSAFHRFFEKQVSQVRPIWVSDPIPNDPFVVRQDYYESYPQLTHRIMFAFLDLQDEESQPLKKLLGINGMMMATSRQYDPVRELVKQLGDRLK